MGDRLESSPSFNRRVAGCRGAVELPCEGLVQNRVTVHKPEAQAKDPALCKTTSRNKRLREWFESLDPSLARQACRLEVVTLRLGS